MHQRQNRICYVAVYKAEVTEERVNFLNLQKYLGFLIAELNMAGWKI